MKDHTASAASREEHALQTLLRAIASRDRRTMSRLLAESPALARMAVGVGASRDDERTYIEIYPLFPPFYVFYDEEQGFYESLDQVSKRLLTGPAGGTTD